MGGGRESARKEEEKEKEEETVVRRREEPEPWALPGPWKPKGAEMGTGRQGALAGSIPQ